MHYKKKLLFVCTEGLNRSPTAASLFDDSDKYEAKFAGISSFSKNPLSEHALNWADKIFVMEEFHKQFIFENFKTEKEIVVLDIPDTYEIKSPELINQLKEKLREYL